MSKLTLGSLFDGSGGFPLGGTMVGITPLWASEIEPFPIRVTTKRMPSIKHYGDVTKINGAEIEPVDIITFGSPCQDMSVAGKRAGLDGNRSVLFYEAIRIIKEMRRKTNGKQPRYIVWENVPGAFSSCKGEDFRCVLEEVGKIADEEFSVPTCNGWKSAGVIVGSGFSIAWRVLDAQYWGVPQRRRRIYLVADFGGTGAGEILFKSEGLSRYSQQEFRTWQRAANGFEEGAHTAGIGLDGYNGSVSDKAATLGVNCGMSTGRNGVVLNDQGGNRMDITEEVTCTLRAEAHHPPCVLEKQVYENHSQDTRYTGPLDTAPTVMSTYGTGGNNQPFVVDGEYWNGEKVAGTLTAKNAGGNQRMPDKDNFNCVVQPFGFCSKDSNAMRSSNPNSGVYEAKTAKTVDCNGGNPTCNQGGIAVVCVDQGGGKSGCGVSEELAPTLACTHGGEPVVCIQGSVIGRDDKNGPQGSGVKEDVSFTLNTIDRHAVFAMTTGSFTQVEKEKSPTLMARDYKDPNAICYGFDPSASRDLGQYFNENMGNTVVNGSCPGHHNGVLDENFTVRRLTPTECARLQGFPDRWCSDLETAEPLEEDIAFWSEVFETHRKVVGGSTKPKTRKQIIKWLKSPHSDSAEYKMWGNGVALPCVFFVLAGIAWKAEKDT